MKHNIYKTMIPLSMIFIIVFFIMNAVNQGGKRERGSGVGGNSKPRSRTFPDTFHKADDF